MKKFERVRAAMGRFVDSTLMPLAAAYLSVFGIGVLVQKYVESSNQFKNGCETIGKIAAVVAACSLTAYILMPYFCRKSRSQKSSTIILTNNIHWRNYEEI